jgi:hypothetical protein
MEKGHEREGIKEKMNKVYNNKIISQQKYQKIITNQISSPKKQIITKIPKKEENSKNINNKTLTEWNKGKIYKRIIQNSSGIPKLYLKKRVDSKNQQYLMNSIKKKELSCNHKTIERYHKKVAYDSKNLSKKKNLNKNDLQNSDFEFELEKDMRIEEDSIQVKEPHMTSKKNYNYFFVNPKTEIKTKAYDLTTNNAFDDKMKNKVSQHIFHRAKKYLLNNKNNLNGRNNLCENRYEIGSINVRNIRAKTTKKKEENKENIDSNRCNHYNYKDLISHSNYINIRQVKTNQIIPETNKESESSQLNSLFNSLKINKEAKINKIINLHTNNSNIENKSKIKKQNLNINHFQLSSKKYHIPKKINLSYINNSNRGFKNNIYYMANKTSIKNTSSDLISGEETKDSPENITDREDDKFNLPIHRINHFFINLNESKEKKVDKSCSRLNNKNSLFSNFDFDTDENCLIHKTNISVINTNNINSNDNNNISSYKKNMERFKNLTTERKMPVSLFLSPTQKNNLFNGIDIKLETKNMFMNNNNKVKLINLLIYKKDKEENKIKMCIEKFLDFKSLLQLSSTNRAFYRNVRFFLFKYVYNKSIGPNTNRNEQKAFISKIILSLFKYCSIKKKSKKELKYLYSSYKTKSKYDMEISKDLTRTFPKDKSFSKDSQNSKKLYNVLTCYSNYNKSIGYAQGINFMAAIAICMFDKEEISFLFLDSLINRFELNNYLSINNKNLIGKLSHFSKYLNKYIPDIISFLDRHDINHGFFSHGWILTLFSNSMKKEYLIYTWAFMIIFGWKFFYSFVIQILLWYKKDIFKANINLLCAKMKNILSDDDFGKNYKNIIRNTFSFMNKYIAL